MSVLKTKGRPTPVRRAPPVRAPAPINRNLAAMVRTPAIQPKLQVGGANDPAEKEADAVADRVLSMSHGDTALAAPSEAPPATPLRRSSVMDQPDTDALTAVPALPSEQAEIELPKTEDVATDALGPTELTEVETGKPSALRRDVTPMVGPEGGAAPAHIAHSIEHPGPGRPLPTAVRADLEPRFGADFSDVRLHDRPADRDTAAAIGARAFAYKSDIWLGDGERAEDRRLMAHELTHVLQQTGRKRSPQMAQTRPKRMINRFIGDAVLEKVDSYARHIPGYTLVGFVLGKNPVTGKPVQRTAETLIYAVLGLHPLGTMLADKLKETQALQTAYDWVTGQFSTLNLTWTRIKGVIARAKDLFSVLRPLESIKPAFTSLTRDILAFVGRVKDKVVEFILKGALKLAGPLAEKVWGVISGAGDAIKLILDDPLGFAKNLFKAVGKGFDKFFGNFLTHLKKGLLGFIFGALDGVDIELPERLDLKGVVSIIFQVLRLTWAAIRKKLVKRLGANGERKVALLEKSVDIIKLLLKEGILGIWQKMLGLIDNLTSTVMGGITTFLTTTLVKGALTWIAGLSNPVGAVVKIALMIYDFIVMLMERMTQIMDFVKSIFSSVAAIARGQIDTAAGKVEEAMGRTVPLILAFLAAIIPISGISSKIQSIMKKLRKPVDRAIDKLIKFLIKKGKKILAKVIGKVNGKRKMPGITFKVGDKSHQLYAKKKGKKLETYVKSVETVDEVMVRHLAAERQKFVDDDQMDPKDKRIALAFIDAFAENQDEIELAANKVTPQDKTKSSAVPDAKLKGQYADTQTDLDKTGPAAGALANANTSSNAVLLRYQSAISNFEGKTGSYEDLETEKKGINETSARLLELDHNPNLAALQHVRKWLKEQSKGVDQSATIYFQPAPRLRKNAVPDKDLAGTAFGRLSVDTTKRPAPAYPAIAIYGKYNNAMNSKDQKRAEAMKNALENKMLDNIEDIKTLLKTQLDVKIDEITTAYTGEDPALIANVKKGTDRLPKLVEHQLQITPGEKPPEQTNDTVGPLKRSHALTKKPPELDFLANEGKPGIYSTLSGTYTKKGYLEADHNPMNAEMEKTAVWTVGDMLGGDVTAITDQMTDTPEYNALTAKKQKTVRTRVKNGLEVLMGPKLESKRYKDTKGAAVVMARNVNQAAAMRASQSAAVLLAEARTAAQGTVTDADLKSAGTAMAKGKSGATSVPALKHKMNAAILPIYQQKIIDRQQLILSTYATVEAPMISEINEPAGKSAEAIKALSVITRRVNSSDNRKVLTDKVNQFFPLR